MANKHAKTGKRFQSSKGTQKGKTFEREGNFRGNRHYERDSEVVSRGTGGHSGSQNDPAWYFRDASTLRAYANYPFNLPAGFGLRIDGGLGESFVSEDAPLPTYVVPGIIVNSYMPWFGDADLATDPINLAAQSIYTYVRSANSGGKNYEPTDIAIYLGAMDSLFGLYSIMIRAYGTLYAFNPRNRFMPKALFEAQGFDYNDFMTHIADFKAFIDLCRTRISQMVVPSGMTYFARHAMLNSKIFADSTVAKSQLILFKPQYLWQYSGYSDMQGGELTAVATGFMSESNDKLMTFADLRTFADDLISRVINDVDCGIISGDLLKAYGDRIYLLPTMPADYSINIEPMDEWMGSQLHNALYVGDIQHAYVKQISSDNPNVPRVIKSRCYTDKYNMLDYTILDINKDEPSPEDVLEATRFIYSVFPSHDEELGAVFQVRWAGSEILTHFHIISMSPIDGAVTYQSGKSVTVGSFNPELIRALMVCNITPIMYTGIKGENNTWTITKQYGYLNNCITFDLAKLKGLNTMVIDTMLTTDMDGKYNNK